MRQRLIKPARERYRDRGPGHAPGRRPRRNAPQELQLDAAVERVRQAGGPLDFASYVCGCGYVFRAAVSTTVSCPHCQAEQAW
jgi:hypothetical protein